MGGTRRHVAGDARRRAALNGVSISRRATLLTERAPAAGKRKSRMRILMNGKSRFLDNIFMKQLWAVPEIQNVSA